jgi:nucleoside-diphosphate-sugar epimerase
MRVLVTGHKGFIGTILVPTFFKYGHHVVGLDSDLYRRCTYGTGITKIPELIKDVRDVEKEDLNQGLDAIIHLAALSNDVLGDLNPQHTMDINYGATIRIAEMAKELGVKRFLFASSCSMYGASGDDVLNENASFNPVTTYAESKVKAEHDLNLMADDNFSPIYLRNATAYGVSPRIRFDVVVNNLTAWAYTTGKILMKSDGTPWRPLVHIEDISRAFLTLMKAPREMVYNQAFNIGINSENYQVREVADFVGKTVPDCKVSFADGASPDLRNYRVNFDKFHNAFPNSGLNWTVPKGIKQIYDSYRTIGLNAEDYEGIKYKRIAHIKHLLASGTLDESLRWVK